MAGGGWSGARAVEDWPSDGGAPDTPAAPPGTPQASTRAHTRARTRAHTRAHAPTRPHQLRLQVLLERVGVGAHGQVVGLSQQVAERGARRVRVLQLDGGDVSGEWSGVIGTARPQRARKQGSRRHPHPLHPLPPPQAAAYLVAVLNGGDGGVVGREELGQRHRRHRAQARHVRGHGVESRLPRTRGAGSGCGGDAAEEWGGKTGDTGSPRPVSRAGFGATIESQTVVASLLPCPALPCRALPCQRTRARAHTPRCAD